MKHVFVGSDEANTLLDALREVPPVLLIGSAVSAWEPTALPVGASFGKQLFQILFEEDPAHDQSGFDAVRGLAEEAPFEQLLEWCPDNEGMQRTMRQAFAVDTPNDVHRALADALESGNAKAIITTNYDLCLDHLISDNVETGRVVTRGDVRNVERQAERSLFKIHGSADDVAGETMVWALRHESRLQEWKRLLLCRLVEGRPLLVIGYSGRDFELCPELSRCRPSSILWNVTQGSFRRGEITTNSQRVMESLQGTYLVGDMADVIGRIFRRVDVVWGRETTDLADRIRDTLSECDRALWRGRLAIALGAPLFALAASEELVNECPEVTSREAHRIAAQARFHLGKYRTAARGYRTAAEMAPDGSPSSVGLKLEQADAVRCVGHLVRARRLAETAEVEAKLLPEGERRTHDAWTDWKRVQIIRDWHRVAGLLRLRRWQSSLGRRAEPLLRKAAVVFLETGNWWSFNSAALWAQRLGIDLLAETDMDLLPPPPALDGARHLGNWVAESMAFRESLATKRHLAPDEIRQADRLIQLASDLRCFPELWKLSRLRMRTVSGAPQKARYFGMFVYAFLRCEYSVPMRVMSLVRGS